MTRALSCIRKPGTVPFSCALIAALLATPALGKEVLRDDAGTSLDVNGFFKSQLAGVFLHPDSVETLQAQARLFGLTAPPPAGIVSTNVLRLGARFKAEDLFELDVAWQLGLSVASDAAFVGTARTEGDPRRLFPLGGELGSGAEWRLAHELDRFAIKIPLSFGDLTLGRQVLSWGTGRFWNPTDVLSPFPPTAVDREVRRGFDAARLAIALGEVTQLDLIFLPREKPWEMGGVVRFQTNLFGFDGSVSVGKYIDDLVFGADLVGDLGPIGVHAEGAYTVQLSGLGSGNVSVGEHFFRGVIGAEAKPHEKLLLMLEYGFNGYGSARASRYATILASDRVRRGEIFGAGKHQLAFAGAFLASDIFSAQLAVLSNVSDPSFLLVPSFEWSATQWLLVRGGASLPIGATPDARVFDAPSEDALQSRGLRSEFGASPFSVFLQVGAYVP